MISRTPHTTIAQAWESYCRAVVPEDAHETQLVEMKRVFYAGQFDMLCRVINLPRNFEVGISEMKLVQVEQECLAFLTAVVEGRA